MSIGGGERPDPTSQPEAPSSSRTSRTKLDSTVLQQHATPDKHMVETMAGGLAVFDYDGDSRPDIFFCGAASHRSQSPAGGIACTNDGNFSFRCDGARRVAGIELPPCDRR